MLSFAVEPGYVEDNVAERVEKVKATQNPPRSLSQQELGAVFDLAWKTFLWTLTATA